MCAIIHMRADESKIHLVMDTARRTMLKWNSENHSIEHFQPIDINALKKAIC